MFYLVDDGTLDTVVKCSECFGEERFYSSSLLEEARDGEAYSDDELTDMRVGNALQLARQEHECEE